MFALATMTGKLGRIEPPLCGRGSNLSRNCEEPPPLIDAEEDEKRQSFFAVSPPTPVAARERCWRMAELAMTAAALYQLKLKIPSLHFTSLYGFSYNIQPNAKFGEMLQQRHA